MRKPPTSLPPTGKKSLKATLILGSYIHTPVKWDLFDLKLPASLPAAIVPEENLYYIRPTLAHTFRPEQKVPPRIVSAFFSVLVLSPWMGLIVLVSDSFNGVNQYTQPYLDPAHSPATSELTLTIRPPLPPYTGELRGSLLQILGQLKDRTSSSLFCWACHCHPCNW